MFLILKVILPLCAPLIQVISCSVCSITPTDAGSASDRHTQEEKIFSRVSNFVSFPSQMVVKISTSLTHQLGKTDSKKEFEKLSCLQQPPVPDTPDAKGKKKGGRKEPKPKKDAKSKTPKNQKAKKDFQAKK